MTIVRSQLVVPGNRPERFPKAVASGADAIALDLEDSVPAGEHEAARVAVAAFLSDAPRVPVTVRVVAADRPEFEGDLEAVVGPNLAGIALPQVDSPDAVRAAAARLDALEHDRELVNGSVRIHPGVETARGLRRLHDILTASERVASASFHGARGGDLVSDLGATWSLEGRELLFVRSLVVFEARAAAIDQIFDSVFVDLDDDTGFESDTEAGRRLGYTGRVAIHPRQVEIVNRVYAPQPDEVGEAQALLAAFREAEAAGSGAIRFRGRLVDYAMVRDAERLLARAGDV